jgi:hypothetical protein
MDVYLEIGKTRTFAGAIAWPGWCRSGKDQASALQTLLAYAPRYARAIESAGLGFQPPADLSILNVSERLPGNASTDFGAISHPPALDDSPVSPQDLQRFQALLEAMWRAFDRAVQAAAGRQLRTGPRGGGRDLERLTRHVWESEAAYLGPLGWQLPEGVKAAGVQGGFDPLRQAVLAGLGASARGELPRFGPRGGKRWTARYFVRHTAWHLLDHLWELEDRLI